MQESGFLIKNKAHRVKITGGKLWAIRDRNEDNTIVTLDEKSKKLSICLKPDDNLNDVRDELYAYVKQHSLLLHLYFAINKRLPSILLLGPVIIMVLVFSFLTVFGDLVIDWVFMNPDEGTVFGLSRRVSLPIYGIIAILILFISPALVTAEQEGFAQAVNERLSRKNVLKKQFIKAVNFLVQKGFIDTVEIWNPNFLDDRKIWVRESLIPAMIKADVEVELMVKIDERNIAEQYIEEQTKSERLEWSDEAIDWTVPTQAISYQYLDDWEQAMLSVYVFASTANFPNHWLSLEGNESDGVLNNAVALRLVELIVERFKERLFSEEDRKHLISFDAFASRCINDFGILTPCLRYTNDVWAIAEGVVQQELEEVKGEMGYITAYLQVNIEDLSKQLEDPVSALLLNAVHTNASIYNHDRLEALRFFIHVIRQSEQYKILKQYWELVIHNPKGANNLNEDVYRIVGIEPLLDLIVIFERAAMYDHANLALDYIETVYPFRGIVGKARIMERRGNFEQSVLAMLALHTDWKKGSIDLDNQSVIDLCLNISWAVVSGRLTDHREAGKQALEEAQSLLNQRFDRVRNSEQMIRSYNVAANYEEWGGHPQGSLDNYKKALKIPGAEQAGLSNLLVNKGIALRQMQQLKEGAYYGEQGVEIKAAIGDADQLPIALHNLAQTYLELAFSLPLEQRSDYFQNALKHAQHGLDIQADTGSIKKRGQLLAEKAVAWYGLSSLVSAVNEQQEYERCVRAYDEAIKAVHEWIALEENAGRQTTYDYKVVTTELLGYIKR